MTPWESLLQSNNGSWIIKQLALIAYIYIYIQTIKDEKITLCEYTTQSFMFYTFARYTFHLKKQKKKGKTVIEYKILKYQKLKMI